MTSFTFSVVESLYYCSLGALIYFVYLVWIHRDGSALGCIPRKDLSQVPGGIPLLGNLLAMTRDDRLLETYLTNKKLRKDITKPLSISVPFMRTVDITDPVLIEYVQKTNFKNYEKGALVAGIMKDILGRGIFAVDGEEWLIQRKATSKIFSANSFRGIIAASIEKDLVKLKKIIGNYAEKNEAFDLAQLLFAFTLSSFTSLAFGEDVGSLDSPTPVPFAKAFDFAQGVMDNRSMNPFYPITELFTKEGKEMRKAAKVIDEFAFNIIDKRELRLKDEKEKDVGAEKDLLELYKAIRDEKGEKLSRTALRDATVNLIIAGRDTTAQAVSWTFFRLLSDPKHLDLIKKELEKFEVIDYDNFRDLTYTMACFHEGLRLHPSVPKNVWTAKSDDVLPNGTIIKAGDKVIWQDWAMSRDKSIWGEDAWEFKPSRWIINNDGEEELVSESQWKFHAFNGGARVCLGQNLAIYEAMVVMATIIRNFDLSFAPGYLENVEMIDLSGTGNMEKSPLYHSSLTLPMKNPFMVTAKSRIA